jgi:hypothetical protein
MHSPGGIQLMYTSNVNDFIDSGISSADNFHEWLLTAFANIPAFWMDKKESTNQQSSPSATALIHKTANSRDANGLMYKAGFLEGQFSDIEVILSIDGERIILPLHRIILISNLYFNAMLTGSWKEAGESQLLLHLDDPNITFEGCKAVFARIYGHEPDPSTLPTTIAGLIGLLAAGNYFGDNFTISLVISTLIEKITLNNINDVVRLVNFALEFCYERIEEILEAAFSLLCREYYSMPFTAREKMLCEIDTEFMAQVVCSDCFYCPDEFSRYQLFIEIVNGTNEQEILPDDDQKLPDLEQIPGFLQSPLPPISSSQEPPLEPIAHVALLKGIDLTSMSFESLLEIQSDGIIPASVIHHAFWLKTVAQSNASRNESPNVVDDALIPTDDTAKIDVRRLWRGL